MRWNCILLKNDIPSVRQMIIGNSFLAFGKFGIIHYTKYKTQFLLGKVKKRTKVPPDWMPGPVPVSSNIPYPNPDSTLIIFYL